MIDISRQLASGHPTWPGDPPFVVEPMAQINRGDSVNTSQLHASTHTGTHVDAPWHYDDTGLRLEELGLEPYVGRCLVVTARGPLVGPEVLEGLPADLPPRLLLHTGQPAHWETFPEDFAAIDPALIHELYGRGVQLIGTDSPSVDPVDSKTLDAHAACRETGILIVEGLNLSHVSDGEYDLMCLPLPLVGVDGAPARAVLFPAGSLPEPPPVGG